MRDKENVPTLVKYWICNGPCKYFKGQGGECEFEMFLTSGTFLCNNYDAIKEAEKRGENE